MDGGAIRTERLTLRPLKAEDAEPIARMIAKWEVIRWLTRPPHPFRLEHAQDFIASGQGKNWAIVLDGALIGVVSVQPNLGYWLGSRFHGKGFMSEAARAAIAEHFAGGGGTLISGYMPGNLPSRRVLEKLGFRPTRVEREWSNAHGGEVDVQKMELRP